MMSGSANGPTRNAVATATTPAAARPAQPSHTDSARDRMMREDAEATMIAAAGIATNAKVVIENAVT
jgi:hypothetical protein